MSVTPIESTAYAFDTDASVSQDAAVSDAEAGDLQVLRAIGDRVRQARKGYTQVEVAKLAGLDKETVNRMELGGNMQLMTVCKVARALQIPIEELLIGRDLPRHSAEQDSTVSEAPAHGTDSARVLELKQIAAQYEQTIHTLEGVLHELTTLVERAQETGTIGSAPASRRRRRRTTHR